jgi:hypothetical protein
MKQLTGLPAAVAACAMLALPQIAAAQPAPSPPPNSTPDKVYTRISPLEFKNGAPSAATVAKIYDHVDFTHA